MLNKIVYANLTLPRRGLMYLSQYGDKNKGRTKLAASVICVIEV